MSEDLITKIVKINPHPTEAIVLRLNQGKVEFDEMRHIFDCVKSTFPNNVVVAIPDYASLQSCSKDVLENIISDISEIIDGLCVGLCV